MTRVTLAPGLQAVLNGHRQSRELFASPDAEKELCKIQTNNRGWSGMHVETLDPKNQRAGNLTSATFGASY